MLPGVMSTKPQGDLDAIEVDQVIVVVFDCHPVRGRDDLAVTGRIRPK
jgi:hypothetical protein